MLVQSHDTWTSDSANPLIQVKDDLASLFVQLIHVGADAYHLFDLLLLCIFLDSALSLETCEQRFTSRLLSSVTCFTAMSESF